MSVLFLLPMIVVAESAALAAAIEDASEELGFKPVNTVKEVPVEKPTSKWVEITIKGSEDVAATMKRESVFTIRKGDVTATFRREPDGRCLVHVTGFNKTKEELQAIGQEIVDHITQQYAYKRVMSEMKDRGFTVTKEEVAPDRSIRIHVSKYV